MLKGGYLNRRNFAFVLLPSLEEVGAEESTDYLYSGGYSRYTTELEELHKAVADTWITDPRPAKDKSKEIYINSPPIRGATAGATPDFIFELVIGLSGGAVGASLYNALKLWVQKKNGRKLRIRLSTGLEVDATQLSIEEFETLFQRIHSKYGDPSKPVLVSPEDEAELLTELLGSLISPECLVDSMNAEEERLSLVNAYLDKRAELRKNL